MEVLLCGLDLQEFPSHLLKPTNNTNDNTQQQFETVSCLDLSCNSLTTLPNSLEHLTNLKVLNLSDNSLGTETILTTRFPSSLEVLILNGNQISEIPISAFPKSLRRLHLSGNKISTLPMDLDTLTSLKELYLGQNHLSVIDSNLLFPSNLEVLYLGGNQLTTIPQTIGFLPNLKLLSLNDNLIKALPPTFVQLSNLEILHLHKNKLTFLPVEILGIRKLKQLTVRQNPLLTQFADNMHHHLPSLKELSGRTIKKHKISYQKENLPKEVSQYLESSKECLGCAGAYFGDSCLSHVEFIDMCGSYRVPFLNFLCSEKCKKEESQESQEPSFSRVVRLRKILLDKYAPSSSTTMEVLEKEIIKNEEYFDDLI